MLLKSWLLRKLMLELKNRSTQRVNCAALQPLLLVLRLLVIRLRMLELFPALLQLL